MLLSKKWTVEHHRRVSLAATRQKERESRLLNCNGWNGKDATMRLIHCLLDDSIQQSYQYWFNIQSGKVEVEDRNSSDGKKIFGRKLPIFGMTKILHPRHYPYQTYIPLSFC
jgi:hypothetical protein